MNSPFIAKKETYLDGDKTFTVFHPAIRFKEDEEYCYFPDEDTRTGLIERHHEEDALFIAEQLYKHYVLSKQ